ncbi:MAG: LysM peptidoglycan-binding domain-containing protein [Ardenticatenales bacterium]|nr:LysM peptidoglycan-binding domain-containing protein [Ardenticatenales bacterium]
MSRKPFFTPLLFSLVLTLFFLLGGTGAASAESAHVVTAGETLTGIALRYGVSVQTLAESNGLRSNSWVYVGQTLRIPSGSDTSPAPAPQPATGGSYIVKAGDTLYRIALAHGTTVQGLMNANNLTNTTIYVGQRLLLSGAGAPAANPAPAPSNPAANGAKWIDVDLTRQSITAYEGNTAIYTAIVSTGLPRTPTVVGTYKVYVKYTATDMQGGSKALGDYYYLRDVPYTMYFYRGYGIHGTFWHNNFGQPMSHGCVNLRTSDAEWFFNWAPVGTTVVTHY